jgi:hypothetical protein
MKLKKKEDMRTKERGKDTQILEEHLNRSNQTNAGRNGRPNACWNSLLVRGGKK